MSHSSLQLGSPLAATLVQSVPTVRAKSHLVQWTASQMRTALRLRKYYLKVTWRQMLAHKGVAVWTNTWEWHDASRTKCRLGTPCR